MRKSLVPLVLLAAATSLPAQLSGNYVIGPASTYPTFQAAMSAAMAAGVSGPVVFDVLPGTYNESVTGSTITGTSAVNTITFRSVAGPGTVLLNGTSGDTFALSGTQLAPLGYLVFDGLDFQGAPTGSAITGTQWVQGLEIRNCTFGPNHRGTRHTLIFSDNATNQVGWKIHHCKMTFPSRTTTTSYGIYESNGGGFEIHDNVFDINGCQYGLYLINQNRRLDYIYNNVFTGSLYASTSTSPTQTAVIKVDVSNFANEIAHNTFLVTVPGASGCIIATSGINGGSPLPYNWIWGNVFVLTGGGTCIVANPIISTVPNVYYGDGNVFWAPGGEIGRTTTTGAGITTLAAWQAATGQDANSVQADPLFRNGVAAPYDLRLLPGSPAVARATNTPAYVTGDLDGRLRDAQPDAGCYESSSFATFGQGCPGTGSNVPLLTSSGTVALGSTNFSVDLQNALPNSVALQIGGFSKTSYGAVTLPYQLGGGCAILVAPEASRFALTSAGGTASWPFVIPNNTGLLGLSLFLQGVVVDAGSPSPFGVAVTRGGALQL